MTEQTKIGRAILVLLAVIIVVEFAYVLWSGLPTGKELITFPLIGMVFCLASAIYLMGPKPALLLLAVTAVLTWLAEEIGVTTGWLFGDYSYSNTLLGPMLGSVPLVIPLYWFMIIYVSLILSNLIAGGTPVSLKELTPLRIGVRTLVAGLLAANYDLSFDPFMSTSTPVLPTLFGTQPAKPAAWTWQNVGTNSFFGVPFHNFYGWVVTAFLVLLIYHVLVHRFIGPYTPLGPHKPFPAIAPVLFYLGWWLAHWISGYPEPVQIVAFISLGIPAVAAFIEVFIRSLTQDVTGEGPGS